MGNTKTKFSYTFVFSKTSVFSTIFTTLFSLQKGKKGRKRNKNQKFITTNVLMMLDLVKYPAIHTEKTTRLVENNQVSFDVDVRITKPQIRKLIEEFFNVKVLAVNTHRPPRKKNRLGSKPSYKRVIVTVDSDVILLK